MGGMSTMLQEQEIKVIYDGPGVIVSIEGVGSDEMIMMHVEVSTRMTKGLYEDWLLLFQELKRDIKEMGYDLIFVSHTELDLKMRKFWRMFGFDVFTHGSGMIAFTTV